MTTEASVLDRLDALESRFAIERLIGEWAHALDGRDEPLLRRIWHADAIMDLGEPFGRAEGVDAIVGVIRQLWSTTPHMHHWMSNLLIDVDGDNATAASSLDGLVTHVESGPTQVGGTYRDRFERRDGRWAITYRALEMSFWAPLPGWRAEAGTEAD